MGSIPKMILRVEKLQKNNKDNDLKEKVVQIPLILYLFW